MNKITWLHLSDIHFSPRNEWRAEPARQALLKFLTEKWQQEPTLKPDFIVCTGDIAFGQMAPGSMAEQYQSAAKFFDAVLACCGCDKNRLFLVPGNHDVDRDEINPDAQTQLIVKADQSDNHVATINQGFANRDKITRDALTRLQPYQLFIQEYAPHQHDKEGRCFYSQQFTVSNITIGICGFNSVWSCAGDRDEGHLWFAGEWQFNQAKQQLEGQQLNIGLIHHPITWLAQAERSLVTARSERDFDFFLHGHTHDTWLNNGNGLITITAGAIGADDDREFGINITQLDLNEEQGKTHLFTYSRRHDEWQSTNIPLKAPQGVWSYPLPESLKTKPVDDDQPETPAAATPATTKIIILPEQPPALIGRDSIVKQLLATVCQNDASSHLLVNGMGGVGKTAVCRQLAHQASFKLQTIIWLNCQVGLKNELQNIAANNFAINISQPHWFEQWLAILNQRQNPALMLLDNLETSTENDRYLSELKKLNWHLVATSRETIPAFSHCYAIDVLDLADCIALFEQHYKPEEVKEDQQETLTQLLTLAGHHTLTIELLAKIASDEALDINTLYQQVKASGFDLTQLTDAAVHGDHSGTATHHDHQQQLHHHLSKLFQLAKLSPDEAQILRLLAIFPSQPYQINQELKPWFNQPSATLFNQLSQKGWLQRTEQHFTLHPVVAHVAKNEITLSPTALADFTRHFHNAIQPTTTEHWISKTPYITLLIPLIDLLSDSDEGTPYLLNTLATIHKYKGDYPPALPLFQRALVINEHTLGPDHPTVATSLNNLALLFDNMGDYPPALPLHQRALAIKEQTLGPDHPAVATSLNNLAALYQAMGDYPPALPLFQRALAIREQALGPDDPDVASSLNNLALLYDAMGDYPPALPLNQRALAIREQTLGPDHPQVATSLNNLAGLYQAMGDYPQALPLYQRAVAILERSLGVDHPSYKTVKNNLDTLTAKMA